MIDNVLKTMNFLFYRFRYLVNYVIIGFFSVSLEVLAVSYLRRINLSLLPSVGIGFLMGVILSFILNSTLNFKVPASKNKRTFMVFLAISTAALILNLILMYAFSKSFSVGYGPLRLITSAIVFMISYTVHRRITFDFVKKVGIALYLNKGEPISEVYSKIRYYSDFIHLDLVDKTFDKNAREIDITLIDEINRTWFLEKMIHIMSKKPSEWIKKLSRMVDVIIFHSDTDENTKSLINLCKRYDKKIGLAVTLDSDLTRLIEYIPDLDFIQLMGITELGKTGQLFNPDSLEKLKELNKLKKRGHFQIIFDGGVKPTNINRINAKYVVSSSGILSSSDPIESFMELKTSARYYDFKEKLRRDIINSIGKVSEINFIESLSIVGSFSQGIAGINDIDIVLILDEMMKEKFEKVLNFFEGIKKELESKYGLKIFINNSLGPLKFNFPVVFHLMIYDKNSHKEHCEKSPFTCYDWQRSKIYFKKSLKEVYEVKGLQPSYFFSKRRGAEEYLSEVKEGRISYRTYSLKKNRVVEEKKYKEMNSRDKIEFSYHIIKFLMCNFLKLYYGKNIYLGLKKTTKIFFSIFSKNKRSHKKLIKKLCYFKKHCIFPDTNLLVNLENFIRDFEQQFKNMYS
jgi:pentose-5-phosphate-3-epimerase/putative flippase GtrA